MKRFRLGQRIRLLVGPLAGERGKRQMIHDLVRAIDERSGRV